MFRALLIATGILASTMASAKNLNIYDVLRATSSIVVTEAEPMGLNWAVGDTASYSLDLSIIKGSMVYTVKALNGSEAILGQDVDLGVAGKQSCDTTLDLNTGAVKKMVCNGQEQQTGNADEAEVVETKEDSVTVPAGTFTCIYMKLQNKKDQKITDMWANPKLVPVMGLVKAILPTPMGAATLQLTSYKKM